MWAWALMAPEGHREAFGFSSKVLSHVCLVPTSVSLDVGGRGLERAEPGGREKSHQAAGIVSVEIQVPTQTLHHGNREKIRFQRCLRGRRTGQRVSS